MRPSPQLIERASARGFSLAEIALALGIISFVLLALFGLLSIGLQAGKSSEMDTTQAAIVHRLLSAVRAKEFGSFDGSNYFYYDAEGREAGSAEAYFECEVAANLPSAIDPQVASNLRYIAIKIRYPIGAPKQTTTILHASIARP